MKGWAIALAAQAAAVALAASSITPFSRFAPAAGLPAPWRELRIADVKPPAFALVEDAGATVLRVRSQGAAGAAAHAVDGGDVVLAWRWKIDRVVEEADLASRGGDDFAARVYVFFEVPQERLSLAERVKLRLARWIHGPDVPSAAICYVWDNRHAPGTSAWNPYTDRVRMWVLRSGNARAGEWLAERRDLREDFRVAFGEEWKAHPPLTGIAAGNDTDQTGEAVTAWFGDFRIEARP